jgi:L-fucose isomerase-like protein
MKHHITLGVVCLARTTFDYQAAQEIYHRLLRQLETLEAVTLEAIPDQIIEVADARNAARLLAAKRLDGLICISGTFHLGHLTLELNKALNVPILLWGLNELPYDGGKIRLNSVCGVNLDASNLYKAGIRNFHVTVGDRVDEDWIDALRAKAALAQAHVGLVGFRAHGFFNLSVYDPHAYRQLGILVDHYELHDIFAMPVTADQVRAKQEQVLATFDVAAVTAEQVAQVSALAAKFEAFLDQHTLTALAVRCWPEFAATFGIAPCAAMSLLQAERRLLVCEGDLEGAASMIAHQAVGGETPFLADFSQVNFEENWALLWHCGAAPCNLWDGDCTRALDPYFAGGRGVTADFVLKSGDLSILRIDSAGADYRVFLQPATAVPMTKDLRGTYARVTFPEPVQAVFEKVVYHGIAHHVSVVYGVYRRPFEILARINGWTVIQ